MPEQITRGRVTDRVKGSPVQVGDYVVIKKSVDPEEGRNVGRIGIIEYLNYKSSEGTSFPDAPRVAVTFKEGDLAMFWASELEVIHLKENRE